MRPVVIATILSLVGPPPAMAQVSGVVFDDRNTNGRRDAGEPGLARIVISNQLDVVTTDSAGGFELASTGTGVVFVSVPDGFRATTRFWQRPDAAPLAFGLTPTASAQSITFIHASDTHIQASSVPRMDRLRGIIDSVAPAFVLVTGDLTRDALRVGEAEARGYFELYMRETARIDVVSNLADVLKVVGDRPFPLALGGHNHARERLEFGTQGRSPIRFEQTGAVVGPAGMPWLPMASGVTIYTIRAGRISEGTFVRLDPPPASR